MYRLPFDLEEMNYEEALAHIHSALRFGICPMLETVVDMLAELGDPDLCFECIQIAGTNGKTSTSRYTAAILGKEGFRVALYTSPELVNYTERMEIEGAPVSEEVFAHGIAAARAAGMRVNARRKAAGERPYDITEFDTLTVAAMVVFAEAAVDVVVLECGMGGRWDATSAAKSIRTVAITGIGLDHMHVLGNTLEEIAGEKAAIIRRDRACVLGVGTATPHSVEDIFLSRCCNEGVLPVLLRPENPEDVSGEMYTGELRPHETLPQASFKVTHRPTGFATPLALTVCTPCATYAELTCYKPAYQAANIACAVTLAETYLGRVLNVDALRAAVLECPTPGRFQLLHTHAGAPVLIDACHNPQSVETFLASLQLTSSDAPRPILLAAVLADKDVNGIVELLASVFPQVICTQTSSPRALQASELAAQFEAAGADVLATYETVAEAEAALSNGSYVACGSITLAGELAGILL